MTVSASRRSLLKAGLTAGGSLVVGIALPSLGTPGSANAAEPSGRPRPDRLDSYLAIAPDGQVTVFFGKIDGGQGLDVAIAQIVADELDVALAQVRVVMGDTALTVNQGGASNASGVSQGAIPLRNAAAEARRLLLQRAAQTLAVPVAELAVRDGQVFVTAAPDRRTDYAALIGGQPFDAAVEWNGRYGNDLSVKGQAIPKAATDYTVVGTPQPRSDIPDKVFARYIYVTDVRVPGMLHARVVRPPSAGATPTAIDATSIAAIPGAQMVQNGAFVAVLAPREWDAIRAMRQLAITWTAPEDRFPEQATLYDHIRAAPVVKRAVPQPGDVGPALAGAAKVLTAEYRWPFHSHSSMGPACAVADVRADGFTLWTGSQKPHNARDGVAAILGMPPEQGRAIWHAGPGSYGRNDAGDAAIDAALLSREVGRPVRVQYMRDDGHAWDPKSPASIHTLRAGLDADGRIVALDMATKSFSRLNIASNEADPRDSLAGQLMGRPLNPGSAYLFPGESLPLEAYKVAAKQVTWEVIAPLMDRASQLRTSHLRDPLGPELLFASECFIDELAAAAGQDPLAFRLLHLPNPRDRAVLQAAADAAGWQARTAEPRPGAASLARGLGLARGRGIALAHRDGTFVANVADVTVDRSSGEVRVVRMTVAHDCGLIINPDGVRRCVQNAVVYATSRALHEEVTFSPTAVTSVDWLTYPILDITETPAEVNVVLIDRPELPPTGAGEPAVRSAAAAIGNAIFDATGVRLRQGPFTPGRVAAALRSA